MSKRKENKQSTAIIKLSDLNLEKFQKLDRHNQSLIVRNIFEQAANNSYETLKKLPRDDSGKAPLISLVWEEGQEMPYYLYSNNEEILNILLSYNKDISDDETYYSAEKKAYELEAISTEAILRYTSQEACAKIPKFSQELAKEEWRNDENLLKHSGENQLPLLILRDFDEFYTDKKDQTRSKTKLIKCFGKNNCDSQAIVTQQLLNYINTNKENPLNIELLGCEGRGSYFCCNGVPFHGYNSYTYIDELCQNIGIFTINKEKTIWDVNPKLPEYITKGSVQNQFSNYNQLPGVQKRQSGFSYKNKVFIINLADYLEQSLQYQLIQEPYKRIETNDKDKITSDKQIKEALEKVQAFKKQFSAAKEEEKKNSTPATEKQSRRTVPSTTPAPESASKAIEKTGSHQK